MAVKTPSQFISLANVLYPTNTRGAITAAVLRAGQLQTFIELGITAVTSFALNDPPASPGPSDAYIIGPAPSGIWIGQANKLVYRDAGAWVYYPATGAIGADQSGLEVWALDTDTQYTWTGSAWDAGGGGGGGVDSVFGRTGVVVAATNDYTSGQIMNTSGVAGASVGLALDTLNGAGYMTNVHLGNMAQNTVKGRIAVGVGVPSDLTATEVTAMLNAFTSLLQGLVPASGGGTVNFLRADGTFAIPPGSGGISDGDYGDIVVSSSGTVWTIDADAVTFAKMQEIATDTLLGRDTAGTGNIESIALNSTLSMDGAGALQRAALAGDLSAPAGSNSTTLATVNANVGSFGTAAQTVTFTVNGKGLITAAAQQAIAILASQVSDFTEAAQDATGAMVGVSLAYDDATPLLQRAALTGDITAPQDSNVTTLATVNANVGSFGSASAVATFTVNAKGLITAAGSTAISITSSSITDFVEAAQDAVGAMVDSTLVYVDATPLLTRAALTGDVTAAQASNATTIAADAVTNAKLANMATATFKGRTTAGTGDPEDLTGTQATTLLDPFTSVLKGLVPASGGGTTNFLRADGTFAAPTAVLADGDYGDITVSGTGTVLTIDPSAVTNAKMANMADQTIKGNDSGISAAPQDLTSGEVITLLQTGLNAIYLQLAGGTMTGVLNLAVGSAALPSLTAGGDTTTGWFRDTANEWAFGTSGVKRLTLSTTGISWNDAGGNVLEMVSTNNTSVIRAESQLANSGARAFVVARTSNSGGALTTSGQVIGRFQSEGHNGTAFQVLGTNTFYLTETPSSTAMGTGFRIALAPNTTISAVETFTIEYDTGLFWRTVLVMDQERHFQLRSYTEAGLPAAPTAGKLAYVSNVLSGSPVTGDGAGWRPANGYSDLRVGRSVASTSTGTQNDFSPTGWDGTQPAKGGTIRWAGTAPLVLTGLVGGAEGRQAILSNMSTEQFLILCSENTGSTAANRFLFDSPTPKYLLPGDRLTLTYDATSSRWRPSGAYRAELETQGWQRAWVKPGNATNPTTVGTITASDGGTISNPTPTTGSFRSGMRRLRGATGASAGVASGLRWGANATLYRGNVAGRGGFLAHFIFGFSTLNASGDQIFVGATISTGALAGDPSALLSMVGFGIDAADSLQLRHMVNDSAGTATKIDLGSGFPVDTTSVYEALIFSTPNGSGISTAIWRMDVPANTPDVRFTTADIPADTAFLILRNSIRNGANAATAEIEFMVTELLSKN